MSRLEKKIHKKLKRRKIKVVFKVLFILAMITNLSICIFIIDKSAKDIHLKNLVKDFVLANKKSAEALFLFS